ncbi:MATE family efflux transporter [Marinospirillum sp. MEB164]|uniref:MATE family efflux transporter n=1 Tax=Marinospirillum alkalitolerans TaxID=3123374 RepID=A0ABW8PYR5_9GAMM
MFTLLSPSRRQEILTLWSRAWPIILSNASIPLLGLVDTAVLGHTPDSRYLAGVALGAVVFSFLYWGLGFLRMGTTGLMALASGRQDSAAMSRLLLQSLTLALVLGLLLQGVRPWLGEIISWLDGSAEAQQLATDYASLRLWSAPAVLIQYVVLGCALGLGKTRIVLLLLVVANSLNILLDLIFVLGLGMASQGVALATLIAEVSAALLGSLWLVRQTKQLGLGWPASWSEASQGWVQLVRVNRDLMLRTLTLLLALAFFTRQGAQQGNVVLAANALLMQIIMLSSYLLDGLAQAIEGRFGQAYARDQQEAVRVVQAGILLSFGTGFAITLMIGLGGESLIQLLTQLPEVQETARQYLPWLWLILPLSVASYLFDGVFIGATWTQAMRDTLFFSALGYLLIWWLLTPWGNHGLWMAFLWLNTLRGLSLGWLLYRRLPAIFVWRSTPS